MRDFFWPGKGESLTWLVSLAGTKSEKNTVEQGGGGRSTIRVLFENVCSELVLEFSSSRSDFFVQSIYVYGKRMFPELERANEVVRQLSQDIFATPVNNKIDSSQ